MTENGNMHLFLTQSVVRSQTALTERLLWRGYDGEVIMEEQLWSGYEDGAMKQDYSIFGANF
jgi:hypothetical protein